MTADPRVLLVVKCDRARNAHTLAKVKGDGSVDYRSRVFVGSETSDAGALRAVYDGQWHTVGRASLAASSISLLCPCGRDYLLTGAAIDGAIAAGRKALVLHDRAHIVDPARFARDTPSARPSSGDTAG